MPLHWCNLKMFPEHRKPQRRHQSRYRLWIHHKWYANHTVCSKLFFASSTTNEKVSYEPVTVRYVVDGDTLTVTDEDSNEFKVRRIGCNTPESVSSDENKNCEEGRLASQYTKSLLSEGQTVYLEYDNDRYDKYGWVWLMCGSQSPQKNALMIIWRRVYA